MQLALGLDKQQAEPRASSAIRRYRRYWRNQYREDIHPREEAIRKAGGGKWAEGYKAMIDELYDAEKFRRSAAILHQALVSESDPAVQKRIERELIRHGRARLAFLVLVADERARKDPSWRDTARKARSRLRALESLSAGAIGVSPERE